MDGSNINWAFDKKFEAQRKLGKLPELINTGSCSLHILHGAFTCFVSTLASLALAVLVLHNGQGAVEKGFSNKNVIETNMGELTLVSKRVDTRPYVCKRFVIPMLRSLNFPSHTDES